MRALRTKTHGFRGNADQTDSRRPRSPLGNPASVDPTDACNGDPAFRGRRKDDTLARLVHPPSEPSRLRDYYLSFFSRLPSMSNSCFWPPNSDAPFPLSLSPSIVRV